VACQTDVRVSAGRALAGTLVAGLVVRAALLLIHWRRGIQDADEAIVGLMAKHISEGSGVPLVWYGQHYMGTLPSYLSAALFSMVGVSANAVRVVPLALSLVLVYVTFKLAAEMYGNHVGCLSALWLALCPPFLAVFSLKQAGYMLTLVIGSTVLLITHRLCCHAGTRKRTDRLLGLLGLLAGFGVWIHPLGMSYLAASLSIVVLTGRHRISARGLALALGGLVLGAGPLILDSLMHEGQSLLFVLDIVRGSPAVVPSTVGSRLYNTVVVCIPALLGGGPLWSFHWIGFSWALHPILDDLVFLGAMMTVIGAGCMGCFEMVRRDQRLVRSLRARVRGTVSGALLAIAGLTCVGLLVAVLSLFCIYGLELSCLLRMHALTWRQFSEAPMLTPSFLLSELLAPAMMVYALYVPALVYAVVKLCRRDPSATATGLLLLTMVFAMLAFVGTGYGDMRSPRFLMPLYSVVPIVLACFVSALARRKRSIAVLFMVCVLGLHLQGMLTVPPSYHLQPVHYVNWWNPQESVLLPTTNRAVIDFLHSRKLRHVYTKYWLANPLIFDSEEAILASKGGGGRYAPYDSQVAEAERVAYLFHRRSFETKSFEFILWTNGVRYNKASVSAYDVYFDVELGDRFASPAWPQIQDVLRAP